MNDKLSKKKIPVGEIILEVVKVAGIISLVAVAPNTLQAFSRLGFLGGKEGKRQKYYFDLALERLEKNKQIKVFKKGGQKYVEITDKGLNRLLKFELRGLAESKPRRWDRKYHVLIFDIKEGKKRVREELRRLISEFGFFRIQDSVWVYPYDCHELVILLKAHLLIGKELIYMVVAQIENDRWIKEYFELK
jgi:DNA-binding transcriptional regulator PaaX